MSAPFGRTGDQAAIGTVLASWKHLLWKITRASPRLRQGQILSAMEIHLRSSPMKLGTQWAWARACQEIGEGMEGRPRLQPCSRGKDKGWNQLKVTWESVSWINFLFVRECLVGGGAGPCLDVSDKYCVQWIFTACTHEAGHQTPHPLYLMLEQV